jgi:23S rRNA (uracil1939-C5)-methyltransferase
MTKKGSEVTLRIDAAAFEGKGIGRIDGLAVFVPGTAPGDLVRARIHRKKSSFAEAQLLEVLESGPNRITPHCSHASHCGGCTWQHVTYQEQLDFKRVQVRDHLHRIGKLEHLDPPPVLASDKPFHYRNKMEFTFSDRRWLTPDEIASGVDIEQAGLALGLHIPGRFDKILDLKECYLQHPVSFAMLDWVRAYALKHGIPAYNPFKKEGFLRNLMIRNAERTGDLMVNFVTFSDDMKIMEKLTADLLHAFPEITTVVNNVNDTMSPTSIGRYEHILHGPGYITEFIGRFGFQIDANAFFQTNTPQAEKLYKTALDYAEVKDGDIVYDLYCGVGSLTLYASELAKRVVGIEINEISVQNAIQNRDRNKALNCEFVAGDMKDTFTRDIIARFGHPDVIITDPPRAGMHADVVKHLNELSVERLVYVSCNTATLARDLELLQESYICEQVQPVDMFPQTYHVEAVAKLRRRN